MKSTIKSAILGLTGVALLANAAMGAVTFESGSLAVAFYQVIGGTVQNNTYLFDLGQASNFRENTVNGISVSSVTGGPASNNIAADLVSAFGSGWANDGTVRWMVIGNVGQVDPTIGGDPARTSYISSAVSAIPGSGRSTSVPNLSATNMGFLSNNIEPVFENVTNATSGNNADGTTVPISAPASIDEFLPPNTTTYFGIGIEPYQTLGAGTITDNSGQNLGPIEGALDVYRYIFTTNSADLTAGLSSDGDAVARQGQYIGTFLLGSDGGISVIPEPSSALLSAAGILGLCFRRRRNA